MPAMLQRTLQIAFWTAAVVALVMATLPSPPQLVHQSDKVQHILAFAVLTALAMGAYPSLSLLWIGLGLSAFGVAIELLQMIPALRRDSDARDWLADMIAIVAVMLLLSLARTWCRRRAAAG
jgi:hypothetical protein